MIRPPPLKLKYDNRLGPLPIPSARKPKAKESFLQVLYKANWRNFVVAIAGLNALRHAFSTYYAYQDARIDRLEHKPRLVVVSIALCVMYALASVIEMFGVIGISLRRLFLVRAYVFVAFVSALLTIAAGVLGVASFFLNAEDLMYECVHLALSGKTYSKSQFRGSPWPAPGYTLMLREARKGCVAAWTQESWTQVINVFLFSLIPALVCYIIVYTYYRQTTDASHSAFLVNLKRVSFPTNDEQGGYTRVNADDPYAGTARGESRPRAAVAGNPRSARQRAGRKDASKTSQSTTNMSTASQTTAQTTRGIKRAQRPPALVQLEGPIFSPRKGAALLASSSAVSFSFSPGMPSFSVNIVGPSRLGIGAYGPAANLSCSGNSYGSPGFSKFV